MAFTKGNKQARGGARKGAGRKKSEITLAREAFLKEQEQHAQDAFAYHVRVMNDKACKTEWRMAAAQVVMARVWGMPKAKQELTGADGAALLVKVDR